MEIKINGEQQFSIPTTSFAISPSAEGYTLAYSVDGVNFTEYNNATDAGTNVIVNFASKGLYFKLVGNASDVLVTY